MAEDRNNSQGFVGQAHTTGDGKAPLIAGVEQQEDSPPRGPRTLLLRRSENGFGFTLRHFIVYPPESCSMLPGHERTRIEEPMDTIFVKQVRGNSPAAEAGLRTGDRVVSVDGKPTRGEQYARVVQRIQQAGSWLRLLVVSKEDDILQRYFGETAHNPETNQRPRLRSPERNGQRQRRSVSMIPGLSPRSRQSWVCTLGSSMPPSIQLCQTESSDVPIDDAAFCRNDEQGRSSELRSNDKTQLQLRPIKNLTYHCKPCQETAASRYETIDEKVRSRNQQQQSGGKNVAATNSGSSGGQFCERSAYSDSKYDVYDRTRPESIYSRTNSEQIYDRIKDPIYERVRLGNSTREANSDEHFQQQYFQSRQQPSTLTRFPLSRAEPQVPIYRPAAKRVTSRRASEGSTTSSIIITNQFDAANYVSMDTLRSCDPGSRFSIESRRDSSPLRNEDSSFITSAQTSLSQASSSTSAFVDSGNENVNGNRNGNYNGVRSSGNSGIDDSVIMHRLRKSFEQKEEFLRRPSQPIGWFLPDEGSSESSIRSAGSAVIPREFYARPQKLQKQIWPPNDLKQDQPQMSVQSRSAQDRNFIGKYTLETSKSCPNSQRVKSDAETEDAIEYTSSRNERLDETANARATLDNSQHALVDRLSLSSVYDDRRRIDTKETEKHRSSGKSSFAGTLSRIHENIASAAALLSSEKHSQDVTKNGASSSLPSSPGPEKKISDKLFPTLPQGLQIVSRRAKQFESGRLLSDDDEPTGDRTSLYRSELSRLSNKRSVPNVAVRKREFESKAEAQEPRRGVVASSRESKSLDIGNGLKGNRVMPVGSSRIHCEPPVDYKALEDTSSPSMTDSETVRSRVRSSSADSWDSEAVSTLQMTRLNQWAQRSEDIERKQHANDSDVNSYADTVTSDEKHAAEISSRKQDVYSPTIGMERGTITDNGVHGNNGVVFRRPKNTQIADEDRATRRVSYLKATWGERMHVDSDLDLSDSEATTHSASKSCHKRWRLPLFPNDIASLRRIFEDVTQSTSLNKSIDRTETCNGEGAASIPKDNIEQVVQEGPLHVKFTVLDGKRSSDRSWKQVWGVLRGPILVFYKDRQNQSPSLSNECENVAQNVDVRCSLVDIAGNYTKRKHVLRLANPNAEVLLQTEDAASMTRWLRSLHEHAAAEKPSELTYNSTSKQQAVPQTPSASSNNSTTYHASSSAPGMIVVPSSGGQRLSPLPGHKGIKKLTSFRNRSPTGQSPINKTRKPSQTIESLVSPKTKTWKGRVAKQLRKMHGQTGSPSSPTTQLPPEGATFKVPLELCPPSSFSEYVPLIVEMCTSIVEARGLEVVGIYRVPGNTAAISHLTESVNKGFENINLQDPRWSDVNVISSLLKSFFRQLPDSLLTAELYPMFIDADKVEDPQRRMTTIRKLLRDLSEHHFETLKYLMFHLKRIVEHSEVNKMEAKNLAIVFGPTLVRASGSRDNMVTMVTDMSHQCRIVESLLNNVDWFFSDDDLDDLSRLSVNLSLPADNSEIDANSSNNHSLLLNNIQKVEGVREMASAKDIVSSIISAANRKIQRRRKGQDETDNENLEIDKVKAKHEAESLQNRRSMALNERQCSVSEIVLMHENKNQSSRSLDRNATIDTMAIGSVSGAGVSEDGDRTDDTINNDSIASADRSRKSLNPPAESTHHRSAVSSASESSRLSSETGLSCFDASSTLSSGSNDTKQSSNDEVTIRTYAGLSATTQERIRKFEQETKAMLQRDQNRQRREAEKREEERRRIEMEWQLAKREMENDDLLDSIVDTTVSPPYLSPNARLSAFNDRLVDKSLLDIGSRSTARIPTLSIAVQQQPTSVRRITQTTDDESIPTILPSDNAANTVIKKLKTDKETAEASTLPTVRYGSLDSLHETHDTPQTSPTHQHRKPFSSDVSDDAGSCFLQWTQKILTINKKLSRQTASPGFWWYISSQLHGTASPTGSAPKTSGSASMPMPIPMPVSMPIPISMPMPGRMQVPGSMSSTADLNVGRFVAPSSVGGITSRPEHSESVDQSPGRMSTSGAGLSSKTLNRFLRGSDLLTSLTSTFDRKWRSLVNSSNQTIRGRNADNSNAVSSVSDEEPIDEDQQQLNPHTTTRDSQSVWNLRGLRRSRDERSFATIQSRADSSSVELYRDPSLHKSSLEKHQSVRQKDDTPEKDTDSSVAQESSNASHRLNTEIPDNDRNAIAHRRFEDQPDQLRSSKETIESSLGSNETQDCHRIEKNATSILPAQTTDDEKNDGNVLSSTNDAKDFRRDVDSNYSNKLEKFESLTGNCEVRSRLKRSESLNKKTEITCSKLKRSESLNKHSDRSDSPNSKLKRSESLTKTEKTECNISKRRQSVRKDSATKLKRKNGMPERSIKRRHTVGGTKDFDKVHWLDNKLQVETERVIKNNEYRPKKSQLRTSSPDLSNGRIGLTDTSFLIEVSFRGPSNVVFNVTNARPQSLPDTSLASKVFKVPLESHV